MTRQRFIMGAGGIVLIILAIATYYSTTQSATITPTQSLTINKHLFHIVIAATPDQQAKGLGGITNLKPNQGMYFPLTGQTDVAFWMKDMRIPIDIIWIKQALIVGIDANLASPPPNTPDSQLIRYPSPVAQPDAVLEVAAHQSQQLHLKVGDPVTLTP